MTDETTMSESPTTQTTETHNATTTWYDLIAFQRDLLLVGAEVEDADETPVGLELLRRLEERYPETINHGRLYTNLDQLVDADLVEKSTVDGRTNAYHLTDRAYEVLQEYHGDLAAAMEVNDE